MKNGKLRVALVGVSFGAEFIPIYLKHPDVDSLVLVDTNEKLLNAVGDKILLEERLTDFNAMLEDKTIDAVHLVTPPATHAPLSIQVMNAGKHCACTIPMGMSILSTLSSLRLLVTLLKCLTATCGSGPASSRWTDIKSCCVTGVSGWVIGTPSFTR